MMLILVMLAVISTVASDPVIKDCVVCLRGSCLAPAPFYGNMTELDPKIATMYHNDNIFYYKHFEDINAINLDNNTSNLIPKMADAIYGNMAVDSVTGDVYYYRYGKNPSTIYKYEPKSNETKLIVISDPPNKRSPRKLWVFNETLYFTRYEDTKLDLEKGLNVLKGSTVQRVSALEDMIIYNIVFDTIGTMYIRSKRSVHRLKINEDGTFQLTSIDETVTNDTGIQLSGSKNGDLYIIDTLKKLIYQLDSVTDRLTKIGAYGEPRFAYQVMVDKNDNIILGNRYRLGYYKATADQCVFDDTQRPVKITKLTNTTGN